MKSRLMKRIERVFPEKRLFLKSDNGTRFLRISSSAQLKIVLGGSAVVAWTVVSSAILLMDAIHSGNTREQAQIEQEMYAARLNEMSQERDARARDAHAAQERFYTALEEISQMQARLLDSEERRTELETGIEVIQSTLRDTIDERDDIRTRLDEATIELANAGEAQTEASQVRDLEMTVGFLTSALADVSERRDDILEAKSESEQNLEELLLTKRLMEERNEQIFQKLEDAVAVSLTPLDKMFSQAGVPTDRVIEELRRGYTGQGGPLVPLSLSTRGEAPDQMSDRATEILNRLDEVNLHRMAAEQLPFSQPVMSAFRFTSPFGYRRDPKGGGTRMHKGTDFASSPGTPIYATGDGIVEKAGWSGGFGRLVRIKHAMGYETVYAHLSRIRVKTGQRVSRGDRIGDMGSSGRSTGTHLHYEVHHNGKAVNPMTFIKAGQNVF